MQTGYVRGTAVDLELEEIAPGFLLLQFAAKAFKAMAWAAKKDGILLAVNSAFRTMEHQTELFKAYVIELAKFQKGLRASKPALVARPGFSNHQGGIAIDINRAPGDDMKTAAPDSPIDLWLIKNAARFGFFRTVASEAWHFEWLPEIF